MVCDASGLRPGLAVVAKYQSKAVKPIKLKFSPEMTLLLSTVNTQKYEHETHICKKSVHFFGKTITY